MKICFIADARSLHMKRCFRELIKGTFNLKDYLDILSDKKMYGTMSSNNPIQVFAQPVSYMNYILQSGGV